MSELLKKFRQWLFLPQLPRLQKTLIQKLEQLKNKVFSEIYRVSASATQPIYQAISLTNKIDNLNGVTISNSTVSGTLSGLTDSMIPDSITVSNYLPLSGGTLTGALTTYASATSTFAGQSLFSYVPSIVHTFSSWATGVSGSNPLGAALIVNPASASADSNLLAQLLWPVPPSS